MECIECIAWNSRYIIHREAATMSTAWDVNDADDDDLEVLSLLTTTGVAVLAAAKRKRKRKIKRRAAMTPVRVPEHSVWARMLAAG